jgi:putative ABC transport system substrate-binding protein
MGPLAVEVVREVLPQARLVFCMVQDPGSLGLLTAPGVTGVAFSVPVRNQLAAFRLVNPGAVRVGVIYTGAESGPFFQEAKSAATTVRLALVGRAIASEKDVPRALRSLLSGSDAVDALWFPADASLLGDETRRFVMSETLKARRPVYAFSDALIPEGALVSDGPSFASIGEEVGDLVNRVAGGEKGRIDMLMPRAELVVNTKIASKLKIEIPGDALQAASRVY